MPKGKRVFPAFLDVRVLIFIWMVELILNRVIDWPSVGEIDIMELIGAPTDERLAEGEKVEQVIVIKCSRYTTLFIMQNTQDGDRDGSYGYYDEDGQYIASKSGW